MLRALVTDLVYAIGVVLTSPVWLVRMIVTGKIRTDWPARVGRGAAMPRSAQHSS
ncbi:MAG: hypothetical protein ACO3QC_14530 [Phycisphaerales bacterium]